MSNVAGNTGSGGHSDGSEEEREPPVTDESTLSTSRYPAEDRHVTWTGSQGFESMNDTVNSGGPMAEMAITQSQAVEEAVDEESRSRRMAQKSLSSESNDFPPLLSTLNINGRLRYDFVRRVGNGRLQIQMVPNERPELVATVHEPSGRLTLHFIKSENQDLQDDDEVEEGSTSNIKDEKSEVEVEGGSGGDKEEELHGSDGNAAR